MKLLIDINSCDDCPYHHHPDGISHIYDCDYIRGEYELTNNKINEHCPFLKHDFIYAQKQLMEEYLNKEI